MYGITPTFASASIQKNYINFINNMNPNEGASGLTSWPQWSEGKELLHFLASSNSLIMDDFRSDAYNFIAQQKISFHI